MFVRGRANKSEPLLLHLDTGLAGGGFSFPREVAEKKVGIKIDTTNARTGRGGGGEFKFYPVEIDELTMGTSTIKNLNGIVATHGRNPYEFNFDGVISHTFFRNFAVTFDFKNMMIYLK